MSREYPCIYYDNQRCKLFSDDECESWCVLGPCSHEAPSNADRIRAMDDAELAAFLIDLAYMGKDPWTGPFSAQFCDVCPTVEGRLDDGRVLHLHECEFADGKCPHGGDAEWWLRQPYQTEGS